jgi:hypothetical protein
MPFNFGEEPVNAGDMTSVQCTVNKGDFPIKIEWYLNGVKIDDQNNGITTGKMNSRISTLSIESIKAEHGGSYTCAASNKAGTTNYTTILIVNGIRFFNIEFFWFFHSEMRAVCDFIGRVSVEFRYNECLFNICIYQELPVIVFPNFPVPPQITPFEFGDETFNAEDTVSLTCTVAKGDLPLKIFWEFNGANLSSGNGISISRSTKRISMLSIDSIMANHRGNYTCIAGNDAGRMSHMAHLNVNGRNALIFFLFVNPTFLFYLFTD